MRRTLNVACSTPPGWNPGSAVEWVIDQYPVSKDKKSRIVRDPNRAGDPEYIVRLVGLVTRVSLETKRIVKSLPSLWSLHLRFRSGLRQRGAESFVLSFGTTQVVP